MAMSRKNRIGLIGSIVMILLVVGAGIYLGATKRPPPDPNTLCEADVAARVNRVIIVDKTDPLTPLALSNLKQTIADQRDLLQVQDRLWVFAMSSDGIDISHPLFSRCRPYAGRDVSSLNADPELVEKRYRSGFEQPLDQALQVLLKPVSADESPILETIGRVAAAPSLASPGSRHIVFVTDLLQHSSLFPTYGSGWAHRPKPADLADTIRSRFGTVFGAVDLTILVIDRHEPNTPRQGDLREYWRSALRAAGLTMLAIRDL